MLTAAIAAGAQIASVPLYPEGAQHTTNDNASRY